MISVIILVICLAVFLLVGGAGVLVFVLTQHRRERTRSDVEAQIPYPLITSQRPFTQGSQVCQWPVQSNRLPLAPFSEDDKTAQCLVVLPSTVFTVFRNQEDDIGKEDEPALPNTTPLRDQFDGTLVQEFPLLKTVVIHLPASLHTTSVDKISQTLHSSFMDKKHESLYIHPPSTPFPNDAKGSEYLTILSSDSVTSIEDCDGHDEEKGEGDSMSQRAGVETWQGALLSAFTDEEKEEEEQTFPEFTMHYSYWSEPSSLAATRDSEPILKSSPLPFTAAIVQSSLFISEALSAPPEFPPLPVPPSRVRQAIETSTTKKKPTLPRRQQSSPLKTVTNVSLKLATKQSTTTCLKSENDPRSRVGARQTPTRNSPLAVAAKQRLATASPSLLKSNTNPGLKVDVRRTPTRHSPSSFPKSKTNPVLKPLKDHNNVPLHRKMGSQNTPVWFKT